MKRVIYTLLCLLILLAPVGVSFLSWQNGQQTPLNEETLEHVLIKYPYGTHGLRGDTEDPTEKTSIALLLNVIEPAIKEEHRLPALNFKDVYDYIELSFTTRFYTRSFRLYASTQEAVMTIAGENGYFAVPTETAKAFLSDPMALSLYGGLPMLPAPALSGIPLAETESTYAIPTIGDPLTFSNKSTPLADPISLTAPTLSFPADLPAPSALTVTLTAGEDVLFSQAGTPEELMDAFAALKLTRTGAAHLIVTATYDQAFGRHWYGTVVWEAPVSLDIVPLAASVQTDVLAGTPVQLNIHAPKDASTLTVYAEWLDRTFTASELSVTTDGYTLLLPTPLRVDEVTACRVIVAADGTTWDPLTITVSPRQIAEEVTFTQSEDMGYSMSFGLGGEDRYNAHLATLRAHYEACKDSLTALAPLTLAAPVSNSGDFVTICATGQTLTIEANSYTFSHISPATWYFTTMTDDADLLRVNAVADGTVVATGMTDYGGYYVVVDHGGGLCSTYLHLSAPSVLQAGTQVRTGDLLGRCGTSGMTRTDIDCANVAVLLTLHGEPIVF